MDLKGLRGTGRITMEGPVRPDDRLTLAGGAFESLLLWGPRQGQAFTVTGPGGRLFRARLAVLAPEGALLEVFEDMGAAEPQVDILLLQALPDKERMELIIEKATELGASAIIPLKSARSISLEQRDALQRKSHRWPEVALSASRQSRSPFITEVLPYRPLEAAMGSTEAKGCAIKLALWERPGMESLRDALSRARRDRTLSAAILAGPEGGFTENEIERAQAFGFVPVSLGERILRTETAAIAAVALTRYELGG